MRVLNMPTSSCPIMVLFIKCYGIKGRVFIYSTRRLMTSAMSSQTSLNNITDELRRTYNAVLLQIVHNLENEQQEELRFYYSGLIPKGTTGTLNILRSLEYAGKMSWDDVRFLKEGLSGVRRLDLVETLTEYEIKRDLTILLDFYARKRQGLESSCRSSSESAEKVAGYLLMLMTEIVRDRFDVSDAVRSLLKARKGIKKVLVDFEEETERELSDPWSRLTLLVVITGEIVSVALASNEALAPNEERRWKPEASKLCSTVADELCCRMLKLGSWEMFCDHVEERYNLVYHQDNSVLDDTSLSVKKKIADVVQHMKETTFFL